MRRAALVLLLAVAAGAGAAEEPDSGRIESALADALARIDRTPADLVVRDVRFWEEVAAPILKERELRFPLPGKTDPLRPALVDRALRSPVEALRIGRRAAAGDLPEELAWIHPGAGDAPVVTVYELAEALGAIDDEVKALWTAIPEPDLLAAWPLGGIDSEDVGQAREVFDALAGIDLEPFAKRALALAVAARGLAPHELPWPEEGTRTETPRGAIVIGTPYDDVHEENAWILVDPGGNDVYRNRAGGVPLGPGTAMVIDLAGNDRYESEEPFSQGAALGGVGILVDLSGDDVYVAKDLSQGAAVLGVGILVDGGGKDSFTGDRYAQGAGMLGYGILLSSGDGDDRYRVGQLGQGLGRTKGFGVLRDAGGDDRYEVGTEYESMYSKWTGGRKVHWSFAQGCGFGFYCRYEEEQDGGGTRLVTREMFPGGVGLILDEAGDDAYVGSMYAQGTAYFYGFGLCVDRAGNDSYTATWYGQGAAPHFAVGVLADGSGNDVYRGMHQVQGNGRDFSTGVLVDLAGDDDYAAEDRVQGCGDLRDGYGIFVDAAGDDRYDAKRRSARGWATADKPEQQPTEARPYADLGVFLDLGGKDAYEGKAHGADGEAWIDTRTKRGVGGDLPVPGPR